MKEIPIIFDADSVNAILAGKKTMTRRVITVPWHKGKRCQPYKPYYEIADGVLWFQYDERVAVRCPYGEPGDILRVKETWAAVHFGTDFETGIVDDWHGSHDIPPGSGDGYWVPQYYADGRWGDYSTTEERGFSWRSPLYMPHWASRISLEVVSRRAERLQDITETEAILEGAVNANHPDFHVGEFRDRWDALNAKRGFPCADNPGVWVVEFKLRGVKK